MSDPTRIDAPARLMERLRPVQEQIDRLHAEVQAALFGAKVALGAPDDWQWDGGGWGAPAMDNNVLSDGGEG